MNKPKCYAINRKKDYAEILIYGVIGFDWWTGEGNTAQGFFEEFSAVEKEYDNIQIRINSPGGDIMEGLPIYNAIAQSTKNVDTKIDGVAASMAAIIALGGKKLSAPKTSIFMLHRASTCACGNATDFREVADQLEVWEGSLIPAVAKKTGLTEDEVKAKWFDGKDHFLTGQEAFDAGLIDELIDESADIPKEAKNQNASYQEIFNAYRKVKPDAGLFSTVKRTAARMFEREKTDSNQNRNIEMIKEPLCAVLNKPFDTTDEVLVNEVRNAISAKNTAENGAAEERKLRETAEASVTDLNTQITAKDTEIQTLKDELAKRPAAAPSKPAGEDDPIVETEDFASDPINSIAKGYATK